MNIIWDEKDPGLSLVLFKKVKPVGEDHDYIL